MSREEGGIDDDDDDDDDNDGDDEDEEVDVDTPPAPGTGAPASPPSSSSADDAVAHTSYETWGLTTLPLTNTLSKLDTCSQFILHMFRKSFRPIMMRNPSAMDSRSRLRRGKKYRYDRDRHENRALKSGETGHHPSTRIAGGRTPLRMRG
jgi:hypothetical protein